MTEATSDATLAPAESDELSAGDASYFTEDATSSSDQGGDQLWHADNFYEDVFGDFTSVTISDTPDSSHHLSIPHSSPTDWWSGHDGIFKDSSIDLALPSIDFGQQPGLLPAVPASLPPPPAAPTYFGFSPPPSSGIPNVILVEPGDGSLATLSGTSSSGTTTTTSTTTSSGGAVSSPFVINITYDASVANAPSGFKTVVESVVQYFESQFIDPVSINIHVGYGEVGGNSMGAGYLGESLAYLSTFSYTQIKNALNADVTTTDDAAAVATLPSGAPISGTYWTTTADAKALGLSSYSGVDGYVGFAAGNVFDFNTSDGISRGLCDFYGVVAHEISEVMGRPLLVGGSIGSYGPGYYPLDLFHFSAPGTRDFSGSQSGYFSIDGGATNLGNFNTSSGGDPGDWGSSVGANAFLAFSPSGQVNPVTLNDLRAMDIIGWNSATAPAAPKPDVTSPTVAHVVGTPNTCAVTTGQNVVIDVTTSESVTVNGTPSTITLVLNNHGIATFDSAHSTATDLKFNYVTICGQNTADLKVSSLALGSGAAITDLAGNSLNASNITNADLHLVVDTTPPKIAKAVATPASGDVLKGGNITITLTMSEVVTAGSGVLLNLNNGATASYVSGSGTNTLVFNYVVGSESTTDLRIAGVDQAGGSITDLAGNPYSSIQAFDLKLQTNVFTWASGLSGDFDDTTMWTPPGNMPTSGNTALLASGVYTVTSTAQNNSVSVLNVGSGATLDVRDHQFAITGGTGAGRLSGAIAIEDSAKLTLGSSAKSTCFNNSGLISLNSTGNSTDLALSGLVTLAGAGTVLLTDSAANAIISDGAAATLTNVGNKILGAGSIGDANITLVNQTRGVIDGNGANNALTLNTGTHTIVNQGTLEGTTAQGLIIQSDVSNSKLVEAIGTNARLELDGITVTNTGRGSIVASGAGAHVDLVSSDIVGGSLRTSGTGAVINVFNTGTVLDGSGAYPICNAAMLVVNDAADLTLLGILNNTRTVTLAAGADATDLMISGNVALNGTGKVNLSDVNDHIVSDGSAASLTNYNTIMGAGSIGDTLLDFTNNKIVNASINGGVLTIDAHSITNAGTFEATGQGVLLLESDIVNSATGQIKAAAAGAHVDLDGITINGGSLSTVQGSLVEAINGAASSVTGAVVSNAGTLGAEGADLTITGNVSNSGKLDANGFHLTVNGAVTGSGYGTIEASGVLEFGAAASAKIVFAPGATGSLWLDTATQAANNFTGTIAGFAQGDHIDLGAINFDASTTHISQIFSNTTGGTVSVADALGDSITLHFLGDYTHQTFQIQNDPHHTGHVDLIMA